MATEVVLGGVGDLRVQGRRGKEACLVRPGI